MTEAQEGQRYTCDSDPLVWDTKEERWLKNTEVASALNRATLLERAEEMFGDVLSAFTDALDAVEAHAASVNVRMVAKERRLIADAGAFLSDLRATREGK